MEGRPRECYHYQERTENEDEALLIFFTDITTDASNYCLLNVNRYFDKRKEAKKLIFIDPGVMELRQCTDYRQTDLLHTLAEGALGQNDYISIDYPCDMNPKYSKEFILKTWQNNVRYAKNEWYICAIQYDWMALDSFRFWMRKYRAIYAGKKKIVGFGNLCRIMRPCRYYDKVAEYIRDNAADFYWVHVYGMALACIKKYVPGWERLGIKVSVDSTKWTFPINDKVRALTGKGYCTTSTRDAFFAGYLAAIREAGIEVEA